jgi:hypothetical protein
MPIPALATLDWLIQRGRTSGYAGRRNNLRRIRHNAMATTPSTHSGVLGNWKFIGRVEGWRSVPKVQPSRFSPFPLGVPQ